MSDGFVGGVEETDAEDAEMSDAVLLCEEEGRGSEAAAAAAAREGDGCAEVEIDGGGGEAEGAGGEAVGDGLGGGKRELRLREDLGEDEDCESGSVVRSARGRGCG